jgi:hypothetical protein
MSDAPRFPDCAMLDRCECARRRLPDDAAGCALPSINALAEALGWPKPYTPKMDDIPLPMFGERPQYYRLVGRLPVPCTTIMEWGQAYEQSDNRRVRSTWIGGGRLWVSTVFMGIDHNFHDEGPPILFETMMFDEEMDDQRTMRCATWDEAEMQHQVMVDMALDLARRVPTPAYPLPGPRASARPA